MNTHHLEENIEKEFHISRYIIAYKFILGIIELILGLSIVFYGQKMILFYRHFRTRELLEDPHDLLVRLTERLLPFILKHRDYIILFLVVLGVTKMLGAIGLYYRKTWGLDVLIGVTVLLLPFDLSGLLIHPSFMRLLYVVINIFIALYLVNFKPQDYVIKLKERVKGKKS